MSSSPTSTAIGQESSYTWEGVSAAACDEILWGLLTLNRAMQEGEELEPVNVSLKVRHLLVSCKNCVEIGIRPRGSASCFLFYFIFYHELV